MIKRPKRRESGTVKTKKPLLIYQQRLFNEKL
jgi:hypothetical protein